MTRKKILVPFGPDSGDLRSLYHALALAGRLEASVLIVEWGGDAGTRAPRSTWVGDALTDVIAEARLAGLQVTHMTVAGQTEDEIATLVDEEQVDLLVLNANHWQLESALLRSHPRLHGNIIRVKEKESMDGAAKEGGQRWPS